MDYILSGYRPSFGNIIIMMTLLAKSILNVVIVMSGPYTGGEVGVVAHHPPQGSNLD